MALRGAGCVGCDVPNGDRIPSTIDGEDDALVPWSQRRVHSRRMRQSCLLQTAAAMVPSSEADDLASGRHWATLDQKRFIYTVYIC